VEHSDPDMLEGYAAVFAANNEGNPEHIFTIEYDEVTAGGMNFAMMNLHYSSQFTYNFDSQPWNGYATLEEFYNSYESGDKRKANNFLAGPQSDFGGSAILDFAADDEDIVLDYTPQINELARGEARARAAGDWSLAEPDVNVVRARAGVSPMSAITAESFLEERGREMFAESHVNLFPIPFEALQAANGTLTQNPGY